MILLLLAGVGSKRWKLVPNWALIRSMTPAPSLRRPFAHTPGGSDLLGRRHRQLQLVPELQ
ncbi:hypothetical protein, partial [Thiohalocapsa halophila]